MKLMQALQAKTKILQKNPASFSQNFPRINELFNPTRESQSLKIHQKNSSRQKILKKAQKQVTMK